MVLTPALTDSIAANVRKGLFFETALRLHGVSRTLAGIWLEHGAAVRDGRRPRHPDGEPCSDVYLERCLAFLLAYENADADAEANATKRLDNHANDPRNWMAAATFLERRWPKRWRRPAAQVEISGPDGGPVESTRVIQLQWPGRGGLAAAGQIPGRPVLALSPRPTEAPSSETTDDVETYAVDDETPHDGGEGTRG